MSEGDPLRLLGSPHVRNALLLNEVGVLLHDLGKLSAEYISQEHTFAHHLILRRLSRGKDCSLGLQADPFTAILSSLREASLGATEKHIAEVVRRLVANSQRRTSVQEHPSSRELEVVLEKARQQLSSRDRKALDRIAQLATKVMGDLAWQRAQEESIGSLRPAFLPVDGFLEGLDQLAFVADLVEMQGRTWRPEALVPPEVKLLRAIHGREETRGRPRALIDPQRLSDVRKLYCEVVANQVLEINNIRKDGPGDLGSWFWKARLYPSPEETWSHLSALDRGATLDGDERDAVRWLGLRPISEWAYSKVLLGRGPNGEDMTLWDHSYRVSALHKSSTAQALITGHWPESATLSWQMLRVDIEGSGREALTVIKRLVEVQYPLGNELCRNDTSIAFSFPGLKRKLAVQLLDRLRNEIVQALNTELPVHLSLSPLGRKRAEYPWLGPRTTRV